MSFIASVLLSSAALAAPAGYTQVAQEDGCTFYIGPKLASGYSNIRAECHWGDVNAEELDKLLKDLGAHDKYFSSVEVADVVGPGPSGKTVVHQVHVASGIDDREAQLYYWREQKGTTIVHLWDMTPTQPAVADGNVNPATDRGKWEITPSAAGGVDVVYELLYEPGGSVPGFVVRWFQTDGIVTLVGELHKYALKT